MTTTLVDAKHAVARAHDFPPRIGDWVRFYKPQPSANPKSALNSLIGATAEVRFEGQDASAKPQHVLILNFVAPTDQDLRDVQITFPDLGSDSPRLRPDLARIKEMRVGESTYVFDHVAQALTEARVLAERERTSPARPGYLDRLMVHEAFDCVDLEGFPVHTRRSPPPSIIERPAFGSPELLAQWIDGYWEWNPERADFLWITGVWRVPPPNRFWVNGYWKATDHGWLRVSGFWAGSKHDRPPFRQSLPSAAPSADRPGQPPGDDYFYVPGYFAPVEGGVAFKAGFWTKGQPGWTWTPARWLYQPDGWAFIDGHWDRPLRERGAMFSPVLIEPSQRMATYVHRPTRAVEVPAHLVRAQARRAQGPVFLDAGPPTGDEPKTVSLVISRDFNFILARLAYQHVSVNGTDVARVENGSIVDASIPTKDGGQYEINVKSWLSPTGGVTKTARANPGEEILVRTSMEFAYLDPCDIKDIQIFKRSKGKLIIVPPASGERLQVSINDSKYIPIDWRTLVFTKEQATENRLLRLNVRAKCGEDEEHFVAFSKPGQSLLLEFKDKSATERDSRTILSRSTLCYNQMQLCIAYHMSGLSERGVKTSLDMLRNDLKELRSPAVSPELTKLQQAYIEFFEARANQTSMDEVLVKGQTFAVNACWFIAQAALEYGIKCVIMWATGAPPSGDGLDGLALSAGTDLELAESFYDLLESIYTTALAKYDESGKLQESLSKLRAADAAARGKLRSNSNDK
jgi:hypothetical protein